MKNNYNIENKEFLLKARKAKTIEEAIEILKDEFPWYVQELSAGNQIKYQPQINTWVVDYEKQMFNNYVDLNDLSRQYLSIYFQKTRIKDLQPIQSRIDKAVKKLSSIKNWVLFLGILTIINLFFSFFIS